MTKEEQMGWPEKFDIIIANPPYSKKLDLKFLDKAFDLAKEEVVFVHPSTPFIERKGSMKIYTSLIEKIKNHLKSITLLNGNGIFEIGLYMPISITFISKNNRGDQILIENLITQKKSKIYKEQLKDLCYFGYSKDFLALSKKINPSINLDSKRIESDTDKLYIVQVGEMMGNSWQGDKIKNLNISSPITQPNFFCIVRKATKPESPKDKRFKNVWEFNTAQEAKNFINYCKTDFARMCIALIKINQTLGPWELKKIPWMDFTKEWTNEKLYKKFNITEEEQTFIKEVIPPYY